VGSACDDFFLYDEALETALMLGLVPGDLAGDVENDPLGVLSALARGTPQREAWEMTKWFDTNYHYVVPEIDRLPERLTVPTWRAPLPAEDVTWAVLGPYSLVKLSKLRGGLEASDVAGAAATALWNWARVQVEANPGFRLQLDEPCLGLAMDADDEALRDLAYADAGGLRADSPPLVTVQFGRPSSSTVEALGRAGLAVQVPLDGLETLHSDRALDGLPELVISVMDGRSVWPDDYAAARSALAGLSGEQRTIRLVPSTSLMFLPYTVEGEDLPGGFQFAREKARRLAEWASALPDGEPARIEEPPHADWPPIGELEPRVSIPERERAQADLGLPLFPTTTIGSLPQTNAVRELRVRLSRGELDREAYDREIGRLITDSIGWQERIGLDVLVHGEFERTDMVEYFAEQMDGFHTTANGWVLSYGSRCTRPPILARPPAISGPMTVDEWRLAQEATGRPVKGMLTGPVTIVNWSFRPPAVDDDRLFWAVAQPIAEEVRHLVEAGARVIQIDEPAVRERWPLPTQDAEERREIYGRGVRAALSHVFNQPAHVQMHTHMCYGTDATIAPLWSDAGVDVASIWYARSEDDERIRAFYELFRDGRLQIGPGVFDVHSPYSPGSSAMQQRLEHVAGFMSREHIWVNPDCGLKTRTWDEVERQLGDMVTAAEARRREATGDGTLAAEPATVSAGTSTP
jgi:5-methyltetrahydropteroyltriglutamate--homocysteine methyltransferase